MLKSLWKYFIATRPWSFTMSCISVFEGTLLAAKEGMISWTWFFLTVIGMVAFHASANVINDYFDTLYGIDQHDSPTAKYRPQPIISGMMTSRQLLAEALILLAITAAVGLSAALIRSPHILWIGFTGLVAVVFYTAGPVKFKYRALGEPAVFLMWGPLMVEGAFVVQRQTLSLTALYISIPFGLLVALVLFSNNMRDIDYDARQNIKTLSIILGIDGSYRLFTGLIVLAYACVLAMIAAGVISLWGLLIFLSVPKAVALVKTFREKIPDMADALTAQFGTVFGILLILSIFLEMRFPL